MAGDETVFSLSLSIQSARFTESTLQRCSDYANIIKCYLATPDFHNFKTHIPSHSRATIQNLTGEPNHNLHTSTFYATTRHNDALNRRRSVTINYRYKTEL